MYKVFLVEDEIVVREGIRKNIQWEQYGFSYEGDAPDGELALPMIRRIQPDLLITDIKMPFMDGLALSELVRKELPRTKIVIISGYDDFSFAQQAIRMGVEQYLLKPIIKEKMVELLISLQKKMEAERQQREYLAMFQREAQEYEVFSRRRFFEQIVTGGLSVSEISEAAKSLDIDLNAPCYNILLFSLNSAEYDGSAPEGYSDALAQLQDRVTQFFVNHAELILFRWNINTHAALLKGAQEEIGQRTSECVAGIQGLCAFAGRDINWYVACGTPVSRLSALPGCFTEASRILSYRYLCPEEHVLSEANIRNIQKTGDAATGGGKQDVDQERVRCFLSGGTAEEIDQFVDQLLRGADGSVPVPMFCRYLTMADLIQEYMYTYLYYEAVHLDALQTTMTSNMVVLMGVVVVLAIALLYFLLSYSRKLSRRIVDPIDMLCDRLVAIGRGGLLVCEPIQADVEEVQLLSDGIESMVGHLKRQIDRNAEQEKQRRRTELALLQAQINPHFLYNTLDTIIWLIESGEIGEAVTMVGSLSNYFRFSLSRGQNVITLKEEQQHIRSYLEIQHMRYRDLMEYEIDMPEELESYILPKLTLQPLVENALYHGIKIRRRKGIIRVSARKQDDLIFLEVLDDGCGMTEERLNEVRASLADGRREGFGLRTVHQRIQILFGGEYGLSFESEPDTGTRIVVKIPMQTNEKEMGA